MQASDGQRFRDLLRGMGRLFGQDIDALTLDAYWLALSDWGLAEFESACRHLMQTVKFMPRPADFTELRKAGQSTTAECWARALAHAADLPVIGGYLQERESGDELLDAAVRTIGGYRAIANASECDLQFMAQRFEANFESVSNATEVRRALPNLSTLRKALPYAPKARLS